MRARLILLPLVCTSLACNALLPRTQPTSTPQAQVTFGPASTMTASGPTLAAPTPTLPPTSEPTAAPVDEEPPVALLDAVLVKIRSGELERGAAIAAGLRLFAGEALDAPDLASDPLVTEEGTGLIRLGRQYLDTGTDLDARAEIERLLNRLLPPIDNLDRFAQPLPGEAAASNARLGRPPAYQEFCADLWEEGFASPDTDECFEYATREIDGVTHRVYVPAAWPADDPRRGLLLLAVETLDEALTVYNTYGPRPVMATRMVLTDLPGTNQAGERDARIYAAAVPSVSGETCFMGIFPAGADLPPEAFKQTLAHELFHCFQYTNLTQQENGPDSESNAWWVEGSAEYFSNVVYPDANDEHRWLHTFDRNSRFSTILDLTYPSYIFFMHLAEQGGLTAPGVVDMLRTMPTGGSYAEQQDNLAAYPGIADLFHQFARDYLDRALIDTGGGALPMNPAFRDPTVFQLGGGSQAFDQPSFYIARYRLNWEPGGEFAMTPSASGGASLFAARPFAQSGDWGEIPATIRSSCEDADYVLLVTGAEPSASSDTHLSVDYTSEESEESEGCDPCLVGVWTQDIATLRPVMERLIGAGAFSLDNLEGTFVLTITDDGLFEYHSEGYVAEYHRDTDEGTDTFHYATELSSVGAWGTQDHSVLSTWDTLSTLSTHLTAVVRGETMEQDLAEGGPGYPGPFGADSTFPYTCTETSLTVLPAPGQDVPFDEWVYVKAGP